MSCDLTKIQANYYPNAYIDTYNELYEFNHIVQPNGTHEQLYITNWGDEIEIPVQFATWDKYKLELVIRNSESSAVTSLKYFETIDITLSNGDVHRAKILTVSAPRAINNSQYSVIQIDYRDENSFNLARYTNASQYTNIKLENKETDGVTDKPIDVQWSNVIISGAYEIQSKFRPVLSIPEIPQNFTEDTGERIINSSFLKNSVQIRIYANELDKNILLKYLQVCNKITITYGSDIYQINNVVPEISEIGFAYYEINFEAEYNVSFYNHF